MSFIASVACTTMGCVRQGYFSHAPIKRRHAKLMTKNNQLLSNRTLYSPWELHLWKNVYSTSDRVVCALLTSCYSGSPVPPSEAMDIEKTLYLGNFTELIRSWSKNKASVLCVISVQGGLNGFYLKRNRTPTILFKLLSLS